MTQEVKFSKGSSAFDGEKKQLRVKKINDEMIRHKCLVNTVRTKVKFLVDDLSVVLHQWFEIFVEILA